MLLHHIYPLPSLSYARLASAWTVTIARLCLFGGGLLVEKNDHEVVVIAPLDENTTSGLALTAAWLEPKPPVPYDYQRLARWMESAEAHNVGDAALVELDGPVEMSSSSS
ncbi:hypothetical protein R3P38DRAFT_3245624 [Favolaschia claudopus]|uniref:Uncharacterized protein n=1 Tax=Favolaschia claudopus TaxID=2862362 RepID=A0AAV9Z058_9AGAR